MAGWKSILSDSSLLQLPPAIAQNSRNRFYCVSSDIMDTFRLVGFILSEDEKYITLRFSTYTDDAPSVPESFYDKGHSNFDLGSSIVVDGFLLNGLIVLLEEIKTIVKPDDKQVFQLLANEDKKSFGIDSDDFRAQGHVWYYKQLSSPVNENADAVVLDITGRKQISLSTKRVRQKDLQKSNYWEAFKGQSSYLHLTRQGIEELIKIFGEVLIAN